MRRLLVTANVVPSSPILLTLMMGALSSSEMSVITRATRRGIPEDRILQVISRLVAPPKLIYSSVQVSDVLDLTLHCKLINFY
jgi:hypothetical protein